MGKIDDREKERERAHEEVDRQFAAKAMSEPPERGPFFKDLLGTIDAISIVTLMAIVITFKGTLGLQGAIVLGMYCLVRGIGHFWGVRLCDLHHKKMRFMSFLGGHVELIYKFTHRWSEGFCSLAPSIWVLGSSLVAFLGYIVTHNLTCLMFAMIAFSIQTVALVFFVSDLDGAVVVKSILFSVSEKAGLIFVAINAILLPTILAIGMYLKDAGQANYAVLIPLLIAGLHGFSEEYYKHYDVLPMSKIQMKVLGGMYAVIFACFLVLPKMFGINAVADAASITMLWPTFVVGAIALVSASVIRRNVAALIEFKRGFCGETA